MTKFFFEISLVSAYTFRVRHKSEITMKFIVRLLHKLSDIVQRARHERAVAAVVFVVAELGRWVGGRSAALLAGFPCSLLGPGARVIGSQHIAVGRNASIKRYAWIEAVNSFGQQRFNPSIQIGERFLAFDRLHISAIGTVQIGDDCLFGSGVYISDHNHGVYAGANQSSASEAPASRRLHATGPVRIGNRVWLGDNVVIAGAVTIGDGAVIGANCVVTRDIPAGAMAAGSPLKIIKQYNPQTQVWDKLSNELSV